MLFESLQVMGDPEQKAMELMAQAEKKMKSSGGFFGSLMGGGAAKADDAAELYVKAGNSFKMAKKWSAAGNAFIHSAEIHGKAGNRHEAATQFVDAANCYKKTDTNEAVSCFLKAIEIHTDMGRFTIAAKHHIDIAEIFESAGTDLDKVITHYQQAADYYQGEESNSSANKCLLKVAQFSAQRELFERAAEIYEQLGSSSMDSALLRHGAKDHFFRAAICRMCQDLQDGANAVGKYEQMCPAFTDSRECKLLKALLSACEENDVDAFTEALRNYDSVSRLDPWHTSLLLRVKKGIEGESNLL